MKRILSQYQKYLAISRIFDSYATVFEGKAEAQAARDLFTQHLTEAAEHISMLLRPIATVRRPKQDFQQQFLDETFRVIGMGILLATRKNDNPMLDMLKDYNLRLRSIGAFKQFEASQHIVEELEKYPESLPEIGLAQEDFDAYKALMADFGNKLNETKDKLSHRRLRRLEVKKLIKACTQMIRYQFDPIVKYYIERLPDFYDSYYVVRGVRAKPKYTVLEETIPHVEIIGTVTDGVTGLPVENAIVNLIGLDMVTTSDGDGCYIFENIPVTPLIVACYRQDYELPEQVSIDPVDGESLVVNFTMTPAVALPAA
jgi:DNA-binding Lrp family transcriptional regulator